ncbi:UNVERIFIED_CONTAM: G-type lectin S-receptor-like serine/threonine-protein kinase [Sesamum angustifolium]|uniref:non-specific serine/threonine protein kinase n=1 Tax=Sesamum angustifolium TaxID=2727405 RepID=A0AAW2K055_9LAMI
MVSNGGSFELGFFSPGNSKNRYLGIWYKNIPVRTIVWVANRKNPIKDLSGSLMINSTGSLLLSDGTNTVVWSTNSTRIPQSPVAQLVDSGNLVVRDIKDGDADRYLWQSFDYPSDTLLPGMKLGWDLRTHLNRRLSSWKSSDDPSPGELSSGIELDVYPQGVMRKGTRKYFRGGPWNGLRFSGAPELKSNPLFDFKFVSNQDEVYYQFRLLNTSVITRLVLNETTSTRQRYVWAEPDMSWKLYASVPRDYCDTYGLCGANGICIISDSPVCKCLEGFKPNLPQSWDAMDWSRGCIHNEPLDCRRKHGFIKISGLKLPDTTYSWVNESMNLWECREECLKNCSCTAYTNSDIRGEGSGCALWFGDLVDIRQVSGGGQDLYIRMPTSHQENRSPVRIDMIVVPIALVCGLLLGICYCFRQKLKPKALALILNLALGTWHLALGTWHLALGTGTHTLEGENEDDHPDAAQGEDLDLPLFDLATVARATENFSVNKKLGEGGFGPVYKGLLVDGQNIAVKRLSMSSGQGLNEFKNEVKLIAKLQHRNLVKLLGCCIEGDEKILIYEYMPNGSLDSFLFDQTRGPSLDWSKRFNIIGGIARGLL